MNTPCQANEAAFFADGLETTFFNAAGGDDRLRALDSLTDAVLTTADAISACAHCPLLQECRRQTLSEIDLNVGPAGIVRAGMYWGFDGKPDFTLNGCLDAGSARQARRRSTGEIRSATRVDDNGDTWPLTVSVKEHYPLAPVTNSGPVSHDLDGWDLSWLPPLPDQINMFAVNAALDPELGIPVVTERWLARKGRSAPEHERVAVPDSARSAEVMSDADVAEYLRRADQLGVSPRRLAATLRMRWESVQELRMQLGITPGASHLLATPEASCPPAEPTIDYAAQWAEATEGQQLSLA